MVKGEGYVGASQGATQGTDKESQASKTQEGEVKGQPIPAPIEGGTGTTATPPPSASKEISTEENVHEEAEQTKGLVYKRVVTTTFCFDCGRRAEYFAVNFAKWEKYLCQNDLDKEKKRQDMSSISGQSSQAAGIQEQNVQTEQERQKLQQEAQKQGAQTPKPKEEQPPVPQQQQPPNPTPPNQAQPKQKSEQY